MDRYTLPLFPLSTVIFPGGLLSLSVYEKRYIDMVRNCLRHGQAFGVVALVPNKVVNHRADTNGESEYDFANIGTSFSITQADVSSLGLINIKCLGLNRFKIISAKQEKNGLWMAEVVDMPKEMSINIPEDLSDSQIHLQHIIDSLSDKDITDLELPITKPYHLQDCSWVSSRWCEILNIPLVQKQRMLELDSPMIRLELIQDMLVKEFSNVSESNDIEPKS